MNELICPNYQNVALALLVFGIVPEVAREFNVQRCQPPPVTLATAGVDRLHRCTCTEKVVKIYN